MPTLYKAEIYGDSFASLSIEEFAKVAIEFKERLRHCHYKGWTSIYEFDSGITQQGIRDQLFMIFGKLKINPEHKKITIEEY